MNDISCDFFFFFFFEIMKLFFFINCMPCLTNSDVAILIQQLAHPPKRSPSTDCNSPETDHRCTSSFYIEWRSVIMTKITSNNSSSVTNSSKCWLMVEGRVVLKKKKKRKKKKKKKQVGGEQKRGKRTGRYISKGAIIKLLFLACTPLVSWEWLSDNKS